MEYQKLPTRTDGYTNISTASQVRFRYRIVVEERDTRCRIVSTTDEYSVGCCLPQALRERYRLEFVPIPGEFMQLYCITRRDGTRLPEISRYLQLLHASSKTRSPPEPPNPASRFPYNTILSSKPLPAEAAAFCGGKDTFLRSSRCAEAAVK